MIRAVEKGRFRMGERQRNQGRSRRNRSRAGGGIKFWCLAAGVMVLVSALAAGYFIKVEQDYQKQNAARDVSNAVEPERFPDKRNSSDASGGDSLADTETIPATAEAYLDQMTLEEKIYQLFILTPEALTGVSEVYAAGEKTREAVESRPVGGIVYFRQNLRSAEQTTDMLVRTAKYFRDHTGLDPFLAVDEEGGQVARIGGRAEFGIDALPDMSRIGESGDPVQAREAGETIGSYLAELGFNLDFAPVADVLTNPENTVMARRSFGSSGAEAAAFSNEVLKGLEAHGVWGVLKHFPGHGGTAADSHDGYAETERTLEELMAEDFVPFQEGIQAGARFIMVGHISAPNVTEDGTPASLSPMMITEILRGRLGYDGIVITDALNMGAITTAYSSADAAVLALKAGNDILLMPENFEEAYQGVLDAVTSGELTEERINQSVLRILEVKYERLSIPES